MRKSSQVPIIVTVIFTFTLTSIVRCLYSSESPMQSDTPRILSLEEERARVRAKLERLKQPEIKHEREMIDDLNRALEEYYENKNESNRQKYESLYEQALELPNPSADVYSACATAANLLGRPQQAIKLLKKAIAEYPEQRVWGLVVPLKVTGYYRIGSIATRIGDSNEAIFAYEAAISNSQDLGWEKITKIRCLMLLADIADRLLHDKQLAIKKCQEMIAEIESINLSEFREIESYSLKFLKDWALYEQKYLETGEATLRDISELSVQERTFPFMLAMTHLTMSQCTIPESEQAALGDSISINSILTRFALAFNYTHHANLNPPKAEKYLLGIIENDAYFKVYAETILEFVHEQRDEINKKIPILLRELKLGDLKQRESAAFNLCRQTGPEGIKVLQQAQQDPNKYVRYTAACNLARWGRDASIQPDFNIVIETFTDNEPLIRKQAQGAFSYRNCLKIGSKEIVDLIRLNDEYYSKELISPIGSFLSNSHTTQEIIEAAVPELAKLMSHPNPEVCNSVIGILRRIRHSIADAVPALVGCLDKQDLETQERIIGLLGRIGPGAKEAVPKLTAYTKHKNVNIRNGALNALRKISPDRIE